MKTWKGKLNHQNDYRTLCIFSCNMCVCVYLHMCGYMCVLSPEVRCLSLSTIFLRQYVLLNLALACLDKLTGRQAPRSLLSLLPSTNITSRHHHSCFLLNMNFSDSTLLPRLVKHGMETSLYSPITCGFIDACFSNSFSRIPVTPEFQLMSS